MLKIRNLKCFYGRIMAIKGVSLSVGEGELVSLIGANGSGKSTLLQAICGLLSGWEGELVFKNDSLKGLRPPPLYKKESVLCLKDG
jgi:branched-chain amino acid transport system ATP-binding protein